jgi:hypothetical protein
VIPLGEQNFRRTLAEYAAHYHHERNHQGLGNELIENGIDQVRSGSIRKRQRLGGLLSYYTVTVWLGAPAGSIPIGAVIGRYAIVPKSESVLVVGLTRSSKCCSGEVVLLAARRLT